jgi:hypothetical protein
MLISYAATGRMARLAQMALATIQPKPTTKQNGTIRPSVPPNVPMIIVRSDSAEHRSDKRTMRLFPVERGNSVIGSIRTRRQPCRDLGNLGIRQLVTRLAPMNVSRDKPENMASINAMIVNHEANLHFMFESLT